MPTANYLYKREIPIEQDIKVVNPLLGEVIDFGEDEYYSIVTMITSMPIDVMVLLDDIGIDFTQIDEWDLFLVFFGVLQMKDTSLIFGDLDLSKFKTAVNKQNNLLVLVNPETGTVIDKAIHGKIADALRRIHHFEKNIKKPGNEEAKKYLLKKERKRLRRLANKETTSQLEELIVAMVNVEQFKYNYSTVRELNIYQFNESVEQIINKTNYEHRMHGVYSGTVDAKELSQSDFNWLTRKK